MKLEQLNFCGDLYFGEQKGCWQELYQYAVDKNTGEEYEVVWQYEMTSLSEIEHMGELDPTDEQIIRIERVEE